LCFTGPQLRRADAPARRDCLTIIGRKLNIDFVNLGFSGEGRGEPEMAAAIAEIDASCFVLDYAQNSPTADELRERYDPLIETIRAAHPETPIVCITPIFATRNLYSKDQLRRFNDLSEVIRYAAMMRVLDSDRNMHLVEGLGLVSAEDADGFVDGVHPNDLGFQRMAERLAPILVDVMGLPRALK
jgi:lysophospholipase L1-like esterase